MNKLYVPRYPDSKYHIRFCLQFTVSKKKIFLCFDHAGSQWPTFSSKVYDLNKLKLHRPIYASVRVSSKSAQLFQRRCCFYVLTDAHTHGRTHAAPCHKLTWPLARWAKNINFVLHVYPYSKNCRWAISYIISLYCIWITYGAGL